MILKTVGPVGPKKKSLPPHAHSLPLSSSFFSPLSSVGARCLPPFPRLTRNPHAPLLRDLLPRVLADCATTPPRARKDELLLCSVVPCLLVWLGEEEEEELRGAGAGIAEVLR